MRTIYKLTSKRFAGSIEIEFLNGVLNSFKIDFKKPLSRPAFDSFQTHLPYQEDEVNAYTGIGLTVTKLDPADGMTANQKIALFCEFYMRFHNGLKYTATRQDGGKIRERKVNDPILTAYFTSENFLFKNRHSIGNLVKYYNELLAEMAAGNASKHPDNWSKAYEDKLKKEELPEYYKHLRSLGLQVKKDRLGNTIDWLKPEHL
jgi:hypothetical protein